MNRLRRAILLNTTRWSWLRKWPSGVVYRSADPIGYAVMIKTQRTKSPRRRSWRYYETFDAEQKRFDFAGRGLRLCADCHSDGTDFLLSTFRPER